MDLGWQPGRLSERLSGTKTHSPSHVDTERVTEEGLCGHLRRGSEGHVELGTDVILQPVEASNNVEKSAYLPSATLS